jgi:opacity protein-like surface antigen
MKKLFGIAVGVLSAVSLWAAEGMDSDFSLDTGVQFQTEYVYRGHNELHKTFTPKIKVGYQVNDETNVYSGIGSALSIDRVNSLSQVSPYLGVSYAVTDQYMVDAGFKYHFYTSMLKEVAKRNSSEIYGGVIADILLEPSLYCFYDFDRREFAIEGRAGYFFDLSDTFSGLGLHLGAKLGFDQANKPYALKLKEEDVEGFGKKRYCYYGINADLLYELNSNAKAKIGIAYEGNSAKKDSWVNGCIDHESFPGHKNSFWFNASVDCSF